MFTSKDSCELTLTLGFDWRGENELPNSSEYGVGFSTRALLSAILLGVGLLVLSIVMAYYRLPGNMVVAGNASCAISAACHAVPLAPTVEDSYPLDPDAVEVEIDSPSKLTRMSR